MNTKAIILATAVLGLCAAPATAAGEWTLEQCVDYAIANNINVRTRALQARQGELEVSDARNRFLPTLSGYASQNFSFGRALTMDNTYADRNTTTFAAGASLNMPIFQGLQGIRRLDYAKSNLAAMLEQAEATKDDVTLNVIAAYLQALYAAELTEVARERVAMSQRDLDRTTELVDAGRLPELDLFQARAQLSKDELSQVNAVNDSTLAMLDLRQLLNLDANADFAILPLTDTLPPLMTADEVFAAALTKNHALRAARLEVEAADKNVSLAKTGYIPTLNFNAGISSNYYSTKGFVNESFGNQMRHNFAQSIGFTLSVPIFDAFSTRSSVRRARLGSESARLQAEDAHNNLYKAITQASTQAQGAMRQLSASSDALASAREAYEAMVVKYENGRANATELEKAKSDYTNAMADAVHAKYQLILRARILRFYAE